MNEDMEHMRMRWEVGEMDGAPTILTNDKRYQLGICRVFAYLPGDDDGRRTAQAICDAHNAALDAKRSAPAANPYMQIAADAIRAEAKRAVGPVTFAEARARLAKMSGGRYRAMYYELTEHEDGTFEQSCRLYVDAGITSGCCPTWGAALADLARVLTGGQDGAREEDVAAAGPGDGNTPISGSQSAASDG